MYKFAKNSAREWGFFTLLTLIQFVLYLTILTSNNSFFVSVSVGLLSLLSIQLVLLFHDCMHSSLFSKDWHHNLVGRLIGGWYLAPYHFLRYSHLKHHRLAGLSDEDTEILHFCKRSAEKVAYARLLSLISQTPFEPVLFAPLLQSIHLINLVRKKIVTPLNKAIALDFIVMILFWGPYLYFLQQEGLIFRGVILAFVIPFLVGLSLTYIATKPLHSMVYNRPYEDPSIPLEHRHFYVARTIDSNRFIRTIFFNLNFHLEHHLHPTVSRWDLARMAFLMRKNLCRRSVIEGFPLLINDSYLLWFYQFSKISVRYNPVVSRQSLFDENERFEVSKRYTLLNAYHRLP